MNSDRDADTDSVDVGQRADAALLDPCQTHLRDHDPRLVAARRDKMTGEWGPWHSPAVRADGGDPR